MWLKLERGDKRKAELFDGKSPSWILGLLREDQVDNGSYAIYELRKISYSNIVWTHITGGKEHTDGDHIPTGKELREMGFIK